MENSKSGIECIDKLIQTCTEGEKGYAKAAEKVEVPRLRELFSDYASQRARFADDLEQAKARLGLESGPVNKDTLRGAVYRAWIDAKDATVGTDARSLLAWCERGEDGAVADYKAAMQEDLPADIKEVVANQFRKIQEAHDRIRALERESEVK